MIEVYTNLVFKILPLKSLLFLRYDFHLFIISNPQQFLV